MTLTPAVCRCLVGLRPTGLVLLILLAAQAVAAQDSTLPSPAVATDSAKVTVPTPLAAEPAKQCYNGCQRWGQLCNVDPRGVYKCQRRCEKFGQICE
jgi:hypothetical protein